MLFFKKHIALSLIVVWLLPATIQAMHTFVCHKHATHQLTDEHQINKEDLGCYKLHIPFQTPSSDIFSEKDVVLHEPVYQLQFYVQSETFKIVYLVKKSSRAPPVEIV